MKRIYLLLISMLLLLTLVACKGQKVVVDYENEANFETTLNAGEDVTGKALVFFFFLCYHNPHNALLGIFCHAPCYKAYMHAKPK